MAAPDTRARGIENVQNRGGPESVSVSELVLNSAPRDVCLFGDQFNADRLGATAGQEAQRDIEDMLA